MPKLTVVISKKSDKWLREQYKRKGDLSKLVEKAITNLIEETQGFLNDEDMFIVPAGGNDK